MFPMEDTIAGNSVLWNMKCIDINFFGEFLYNIGTESILPNIQGT